jgi:hypothetical protein
MEKLLRALLVVSLMLWFVGPVRAYDDGANGQEGMQEGTDEMPEAGQEGVDEVGEASQVGMDEASDSGQAGVDTAGQSGEQGQE